MFNLPEHEAMDHEWLYYFVTGNGGTIAVFEVDTVEQKDKTHAVAILNVRQQWEDGSFSPEEDIEEHRLYMEKVGGKWLISDFDEHKQDCINGIANWRKEEALRQAISQYLVKEVGTHYQKGEFCIPVLMLVATEEDDPAHASVWGDFWVFNYDLAGDTLKCVAGGSHPGLMHLRKAGGSYEVTAFERVEDGSNNLPTAKKIFGTRYDAFHTVNSDEEAREAARAAGLAEFVRKHGIKASLYQDYGWPAKKLE